MTYGRALIIGMPVIIDGMRNVVSQLKTRIFCEWNGVFALTDSSDYRRTRRKKEEKTPRRMRRGSKMKTWKS